VDGELGSQNNASVYAMVTFFRVRYGPQMLLGIVNACVSDRRHSDVASSIIPK